MVDQRRFDDQRWVDSRAAAKHLGISQRTLYAYVSRGRVRSVAGGRGRPRMYALGDLERLRVRRDARLGHGAVAAGALRWGEPVLDSAITAITPAGPAYRGRHATALAAAGARFENVAELLWSGFLPGAPVLWPKVAIPIAQVARLVPYGSHPLDVMPLVIQAASLLDPQRRDGRPDAIVGRGRRLIPLLAAALAPELASATATRALGAPTIAGIAARALGLDDELAPVLDRALVLLADHELNASSFAARVAASTEADPYACVAAALATVSGARHGSAPESIAHFADEIGSADQARTTVRALARKHQLPPGFGHPLYPAGDPRAPPLLELARARAGSAKRARTLLAIVDATDAHPSVDVALAALAAALAIPPPSASGLFAVARCAGWLAHVLEQRAQDFLLRPRARYIGPAVVP
jgi:citrate synthase